MWWLIFAVLVVILLFAFSKPSRRPEPIRSSIVADLSFLHLGLEQVDKIALVHSDCSKASEVRRLLVEATVIIGLVDGLLESGKLDLISRIEELEAIRTKLDEAREKLSSARKLLRNCCEEKKSGA